MMEFEEVVKNRLERCHKILCKKEAEYASDCDRLHNFRVAARILDTTMEKALWGMATKHLVSVVDLVNFPGDATEQLLDDKITDMINYLLLLEFMLRERMGERC